MNKFKRIYNVLAGIGMLLISLVMLAIPDLGYLLATWILGAVLVVNGFRQLIYFLGMGIHMVGGKMILYRALITLDIGFFTLSIQGTGQRYILFYFTIYYLFAGIISIFRALESRKLEADSWKIKLAGGLFDIGIVAACLVNNHSEQMMLVILCFALSASAVTRIVMAFKKSAIIYIQ